MVIPDIIKSKYEELLPGMMDKVPDEVYHSSDGHSRTNICHAADKGIAHMLMEKGKTLDSDNVVQGSMTHDPMFFPEQFRDKYLVGPTVRRNTKAWKEFKGKHPGKTIVTSVMSDKAFRMRDALMANPRIREILEAKEAIFEASVWATDPATGLLLKCRPDILLDGVIYDLKTTIKPHKEAFRHSCYTYNYSTQRIMYPRVCNMVGMVVSDFQFLVVGSNEPHLTAIYDLGDDLIEHGYLTYERGVAELHRYYNTKDKWDGLPYGRETVTL